jgi:hypothetical protein
MKKLGVCRGCIDDYFGNYIHAVHLELVADSFGTNAENKRNDTHIYTR